MNYISALINIAVGIVAMVVGCVGLTQYFGGTERKIERLEQLKAEGQITMAQFDTTVLEVSVKRIKAYTLGYKFNVNEKSYKGTYGFGDYSALDSLTGFITYLPSDPSQNSADLDRELTKAKKILADDEKLSFSLWLGIGLILFALFNFYRAVTKVKRALQPNTTASQPPPLPASSSNQDSDFV